MINTHMHIYTYIMCVYITVKKSVKNKSVHDRKTSSYFSSSFGIHLFSHNTPYTTMLTEINIYLAPNVEVKMMTAPSRLDPETADHICWLPIRSTECPESLHRHSIWFDTYFRVKEKALCSRSQGGKHCQGNLTIGTKRGGIDPPPKADL